MKISKYVAMCAVVFLALSLCTAAQENVRAQESVRLTNGEWPPFLSEDLEHYGVASRIVTEAFAEEGITVEYGFFPWKRAFMLAQKGQEQKERWDGTLVWSYSDERVQDFYFSDAVIHSSFVFFHLKTTAFDWNTIDDLKDFKIGATLGYNYGEDFETAEKDGMIKVHRVAEDEQNFIKVLKGRIQIFPQDVDVGYAMLHKQFTKEEAELFTHHPLPVKAVPFSLILSKNVDGNEQLLDVFNRGLKTLRESGKIDQYLSESRKGEYTKESD